MAVSTNSQQITPAVQAALTQLFKICVTDPCIGNTEVTPATQLRRGFVVVNENNAPVSVAMNTFRAIDSEVGTNVRAFNETLHKSFSEVMYGDPYELLLTQIMHYMSTYGAEAVGMKAGNFIPYEKLELPAHGYSVKNIVVIRKVSVGDMVDIFNDYLTRLKAPNDRVRNAVSVLLPFATLRVDDVASFEVQVMYADARQLYPTNPVSGLRYLIYKVTGNTLLIKNQRTVKAIKAYLDRSRYDSKAAEIAHLPRRVFLGNMVGYARVFLRYKPLFLAFKKYPGCGPIVNQLRRMADTYHVPLSEDAVQNYIAMMAKGRFISASKVLEKASNRDLVKIINSCLAHNVTEPTPAVFNVRNGRIFVKENGLAPLTAETAGNYRRCIGECMRLLYSRLHEKFVGKIFLLPEDISYSVPTTEKQMMGPIPFGTKVSLEKGKPVIAGVHWFNNVDKKSGLEHRVDIDLHMNSITRHFGWNGGWSRGEDIAFTGDLTNAPYPYGAAEAWYVKVGDEDFVFDVSLFSGDPNTEFKVFFSKGTADMVRRDYTFDPRAVIAPPVKMTFGDKRHVTLGLLSEDGFYFYDGTLTEGIVPHANYAAAITGIKNSLRNRMTLEQFLTAVGANVIHPVDLAELDDETKAQVFDLSPESLGASTLIDLVDGVIED